MVSRETLRELGVSESHLDRLGAMYDAGLATSPSDLGEAVFAAVRRSALQEGRTENPRVGARLALEVLSGGKEGVSTDSAALRDARITLIANAAADLGLGLTPGEGEEQGAPPMVEPVRDEIGEGV